MSSVRSAAVAAANFGAHPLNLAAFATHTKNSSIADLRLKAKKHAEALFGGGAGQGAEYWERKAGVDDNCVKKDIKELCNWYVVFLF